MLKFKPSMDKLIFKDQIKLSLLCQSMFNKIPIIFWFDTEFISKKNFYQI